MPSVIQLTGNFFPIFIFQKQLIKKKSFGIVAIIIVILSLLKLHKMYSNYRFKMMAKTFVPGPKLNLDSSRNYNNEDNMPSEILK